MRREGGPLVTMMWVMVPANKAPIDPVMNASKSSKLLFTNSMHIPSTGCADQPYLGGLVGSAIDVVAVRAELVLLVLDTTGIA